VSGMRAREWETDSFRPSRTIAQPFLKWAGGKRASTPILTRLIGQPDPGHTYFEPFLGSGAAFFAIRPDHAVLSDVNWPLVETFKVVKNRAPTLASYLDSLPPRPTRDQYYLCRKRFNDLLGESEKESAESSVELAALFIWLNHTCYNGLFRVNGSGKFNVPFGGKGDRFIFSVSRLRAASQALRQSHSELYSANYSSVLEKAKRGDVVYLDPPYEPVGESKNFTAYSAGGFTTDDQVRLSTVVHSMVERGVRVVLSNSSAPIIRELYHGFDFYETSVTRAISCNGESRSAVPEVVVVSKT
jgi:DNA adenine methylase